MLDLLPTRIESNEASSDIMQLTSLSTAVWWWRRHMADCLRKFLLLNFSSFPSLRNQSQFPEKFRKPELSCGKQTKRACVRWASEKHKTQESYCTRNVAMASHGQVSKVVWLMCVCMCSDLFFASFCCVCEYFSFSPLEMSSLLHRRCLLIFAFDIEGQRAIFCC